MADPVQLRTSRILLRPWVDADREPFAALNADPDVMRHFASTLTRAQSDAFVDRIVERFDQDGYGWWAVEVIDSSPFIGFVGLNRVPPTVPIKTQGREIGWRLAKAFWHQGYATEAARAAVEFGFQQARLPEIVSFTASSNEASQAVMRRLGMTRDPGEDFDHPAIPEGHPVRRHVLYRLLPG